MTAITDTRKRSRDEDTCDFMPISKRINNLTLTSQSFGEQDQPTAQTVHNNGATNHFMAINNQEIQTEHFAHNSLVNGYPNNMSHHYLNNGQPAAHHSNYHQSHIVQSTNHSNGFHNGNHLAIGTNAHKSNQQMHHQSHQTHEEQNNNHMDDVYSPELTADENPFYYDKNKLLFDLHVERQRRHQSHH